VTQPADKESNSVKHVVIVGGGFAGPHCARKLAANPNVRVSCSTKTTTKHIPALALPGRHCDPRSQQHRLQFTSNAEGALKCRLKMTEVVAVDLASRTVQTAPGKLYQGDFLVLAAGSQANFFGTPGAQQNTYPLYSLRDAERLRSRVLAMLESVPWS
jgi:NADH dehydrogenase